MSELTIIRGSLSHAEELIRDKKAIELNVSRTTLHKRRWRGKAEDSREFGFDLTEPLKRGVVFFMDGDFYYVLGQLHEEVLHIPVQGAEQSANLAWNLGNLHFGIQVLPGAIQVSEDTAILQMLMREGIKFQRVTTLFTPLSGGAHGHGHGHSHG